ncbi:PREDICTED: uncharacterized protein LOC108560970 [Nicrophorus vespilloides]|uniref:Uncharacterized protein LOC108560970 n=1 Tax=Nicrophorus vespilloides TaxID=110193 RepID=A0ABM1MI00_NICVS|nr:PREDICTED: uncharacterized protein LOC108560970 [Nicrophorus vespilloides]
MANPVLSLNENFMYNSMLARALLQLVSVTERDILQLWLDKLHEMDENSDEMSIRNEYMWFLLLQLQNKRIIQPFNKSPPNLKLKPLKNVLPQHVYEEVLTSTEQNMSWLGQAGEEPSSKETDDNIADPPSSLPCMFLQNQPTPRNGIICYFAAFSDQDY